MDLVRDNLRRLNHLPREFPKSVYLFVNNADLYQEVLRGLQQVPDLKLSGSSPELDLDQVVQADLFLVSAAEESQAREFLAGLRGSMTHGLTPILLASPQEPEKLGFPFFDYLITLPLSGFDCKAALKTLAPLQARLEGYPPHSPTQDEKACREINLLRFIHSRQLEEVAPQREESSPLGFSVPWADAILGVGSGRAILELNRLAQEGLFLGETETLVNLCPICGDYRINFRGVCPAFLSPRIRRTMTVQHLSCGHIAPQSSFLIRDKYVCPQCGKEMRYLGVDYANPGEVTACEACGQASQEAELGCLCIKCGAAFGPREARQFAVHRFRLTPQAVEAATLGLHSKLDLNDVIHYFLNTYSYPFFEKYLQLEIKRALRYQTSFSLISLAFSNLADVESQLGWGAKWPW